MYLMTRLVKFSLCCKKVEINDYYYYYYYYYYHYYYYYLEIET